MLGSMVVYSGLTLAFAGVVLLLVRRTRRRAPAVVLAGILLALLGFVLPAPESHAAKIESHLDELVPSWQFREVHTAHVAAPPERVYAAIRATRADDITFFRTLTWIRRGGRDTPESILNAGSRDGLLDVATRSGFVWLANDAPREMVVGTVVVHPRNARGTVTPDVFRRTLRPGFALGAMNFVVRPDGEGGSLVSTETRVFANDARSRRRFAAYWRVIYPGSALIRRMWLRAVERRATH